MSHLFKLSLAGLVVFLCFAMEAKVPPIVGKVEKIRGKVTQLRAGAHLASIVQQDDTFIEDTSLVTYENSFVQVRMSDQSLVSLGPKSMLLLKETSKPDSPGVITLLKGRLRSQVEGDTSKRTKLMIRTQTAAMGVRGTDFQTIYNPQNKNTALVTFEGKVAMAQLDEEQVRAAMLEKVRNIEIDEVTAQGISVKQTDETLGETKSLVRVLESDKVIEVKGGQFSGTVQALERASEPVKISPVQLNALYKNAEMKEKSEETVKATEEEVQDLDSLRLNVKQEPQKVAPEGVIDVKNDVYAPKSGGLVDLESGIYVPPPKDSEFNDKYGVFVPKNVGAVDVETGQYKAPDGVKLDASKGFVPVPGAKANDTVLLATISGLNQNLNTNVVLSSHVNETVMQEPTLTLQELSTKDQLKFEAGFMSQKLEYSNDPQHGDVTLKADSYKYYEVWWFMASGTQFQPFISIGAHYIDYKTSNPSVLQGSDKHLAISTGGKLILNDRWNLLAIGSTEQTPYLKYTGTQQSIERVARIKMKARATGTIWEKDKWNLVFDGCVIFMPSKTKADMETGIGYGFEISPKIRYQWRPVRTIEAGPLVRNEMSTVSGPGFQSDANQFTGGLLLNYRHFF
ncbi:MAG: FecR domain-containing protein [Bdellovibrio sp.]|nr:FecR domain-containing protein [Bdellovibrio sp.]